MKKVILIFLLLSPLFYTANAQKKLKPIYYLIDTASIPVADRMFNIYTNGNAYTYALNCFCLMPWLSNALFIRSVNDKGIALTQSQVNKLKLLTLRELIDIIVKYSVVRKKENIFYFIEKKGDKLMKHEVLLMEPYSNYDPGVHGVSIPSNE